MKKLLLLLILTAIFSCKNESKDKSTSENTSKQSSSKETSKEDPKQLALKELLQKFKTEKIPFDFKHFEPFTNPSEYFGEYLYQDKHAFSEEKQSYTKDVLTDNELELLLGIQVSYVKNPIPFCKIPLDNGRILVVVLNDPSGPESIYFFKLISSDYKPLPKGFYQSSSSDMSPYSERFHTNSFAVNNGKTLTLHTTSFGGDPQGPDGDQDDYSSIEFDISSDVIKRKY